MGLLDRFRKDEPKDDPFAGNDDPFGQPPPGQQGQPPQGAPSQDPYGQQSQDPFGQQQFPPPGQQQFDPTNPDMNAAQGIPRPRDPSTREPDSGVPQGLSQQGGSQGHTEKDLQLILAKLDALKSELDSVHQRIQKIERIADEDRAAAQQQRRYARW